MRVIVALVWSCGIMSYNAPTHPTLGAVVATPQAILLAEVMINVSIVEDDAKLRGTLERYLSAQPGFQCASVYPNAEAALAGLPKVNPHVVLMDISLPGMDGAEVLTWVRRNLTVSPEVVVVSGESLAFLNTRFAGLGVRAILSKPVLPADLIAALDAA